MKYQLNSPQRYARTIYFIAKTSVKLMIPFKNRQKACWLVRDVMDMGPVYIKIGQIVSSRTDIFPDYLTIPLSELQNNVYSSNFDDIKTLFYNNFSEHI